jgi:hypothetical protein
MFLAGETIACVFGSRIPLPITPAFIEAAKALSVAYLAVEILLLPAAPGRWAVLGALGLLHGLHFAGFPPLFLAGAALAQLLPLLVLGAIQPWYLRARKPLAGILLAVAALWFFVRLAG